MPELNEEGWLIVGAIVVIVLTMTWQGYLECQRRDGHRRDQEERDEERRRENDRHKSACQRQIDMDYENKEGAFLLQELYDYRAQFQEGSIPYYRDFHDNHPRNIDRARSKLKKFWERTLRLYEAGDMPDHFLGKRTTWLQYGHNYRVVAEPIDIANYYRLGLWQGSGHYLEGNNRPHPYTVLEKTWREAGEHAVDTVAVAREMREEVDPTPVA